MAEAAARTGADAVVLRVEGPGGRPVIATAGSPAGGRRPRRADAGAARGTVVPRRDHRLDVQPSGRARRRAVPLGARRAARSVRRRPGHARRLRDGARTPFVPSTPRSCTSSSPRSRPGTRERSPVRGRRGHGSSSTRRPASPTAAATKSSSGARSLARAGPAARSPSCSSASRTARTRDHGKPEERRPVRATPHARDAAKRHLVQARRARVRDPAARDARVGRHGPDEAAPRGSTTRVRDTTSRRSRSGTSSWQPEESVEALEARVEAALSPSGETRGAGSPLRVPSPARRRSPLPPSRPIWSRRRNALREDVLEAVAREILDARPFGRSLAVVALDVEGLDELSELDRESADAALARVAKRLSESVGSGTVLRLSASEFVLVLSEADRRRRRGAARQPARAGRGRRACRHPAHRRHHRARRARRSPDRARACRARALAGEASGTRHGRGRRSRSTDAAVRVAFQEHIHPAAKRTASGISRDRHPRSRIRSAPTSIRPRSGRLQESRAIGIRARRSDLRRDPPGREADGFRDLARSASALADADLRRQAGPSSRSEHIHPAAKRTASGISRDRHPRSRMPICADKLSTVRSGYLVRGCIPRIA